MWLTLVIRGIRNKHHSLPSGPRRAWIGFANRKDRMPPHQINHIQRGLIFQDQTSIIGNNNYFSYIYTLVIFYLALLLILLEHGYFGCLNCEELENCPANLVIKRLKKYVTN